MNNKWNKVIYKLWAPIYDHLFNSKPFYRVRKEMFSSLNEEEKKQILFVGVGTGADLEHIDTSKFQIIAIDYSPDMLRKAKEKFPNSSIDFKVMDAQQLNFENETFDYVIANLILSVVPNPEQAMQEMSRVLKRDGELFIFDKFAPLNQSRNIALKLLRPVIARLGTDIGLSFEKLFEKCHKGLQVQEDKPVMFKGMYRRIVIRKEKFLG